MHCSLDNNTEKISGVSPHEALPVRPRKRRKVEIDWDSISDEELLKVRICDLPIRMEGTRIEEHIQEVRRELDQKGIKFHPVCYLADEWFTLEGDPVAGIPFYLAHPRLTRLERKMVLEAEGETRSWFMKLLRHEMGHAVSHAYDLHKCRGYSRIFGRSSKAYRETYRPRPYSHRYVQHLEDWYAQCHPDEDFAETFAVWLTPDLDWKERYKGWPALEKLRFVDRMMADIAGKPPLRGTAEKLCRLSTLRFTLETYYKRKRKSLEEDFPEFFDRDLSRIFAAGDDARGEMASRFLRRNRGMLVRCVSQWTGEKRYTVEGLVTRFAERCQHLRLRIHSPEAETMAQVVSCLTSMASNYFLTGKFKRPK